MGRKIRTLLFSALYPSSVRPSHGIFVETRLRELLKSGQVETKVVAPVPWFPLESERFGEYALFARTPHREVRNGIEVLHPRFPLLPKVGMNFAPFSMALAALPAIRKLQREGFDFDLIDAHYYYPDGVAAALLARHLGKPFVVTARGTDINFIPRYRIPKKLILWAASRAEASISVCRALRDEIEGLGAEASRLVVLRNGVDLERFHPVSRAEARAALNWPDVPTLLSVGYLIERKGHHIAIEALAGLPGYRLVIAGTGNERNPLEQLARSLGVADRVTFAGAVPNTDLYRYYSAADVMVLASSREGWANVLLESLACGTPVVATRIWGTPEVVAAPEAGRLADQRSAPSFTKAIQELMGAYPAREAVRRYAENFGWEETTRGQLELFSRISGVDLAGTECCAGVGASQVMEA
ncbi:MAG: glycosyltransferase family 4 protein [Rhodocyclaceae bacterium]|nr:glycosyltransferase family 4 protein [Rhodocyclaceae bacterium]